MEKPVAAKWRVFKGKGALSLSLVEPELKDAGNVFEVKQGAVRLEFASKVEDNYDWSNKIVFQLYANDIGEILSAPEGFFSMIHNPDINKPDDDRSKEKILQFSESKDRTKSMGFLSVSYSQGNERIAVSLTDAEYTVFVTLLERLLPIILGF